MGFGVVLVGCLGLVRFWNICSRCSCCRSCRSCMVLFVFCRGWFRVLKCWLLVGCRGVG